MTSTFTTTQRDAIAFEILGLAAQRYGQNIAASLNIYGLADEFLGLERALEYAEADRAVILGGITAIALGF